jgi:hypothetical protein
MKAMHTAQFYFYTLLISNMFRLAIRHFAVIREIDLSLLEMSGSNADRDPKHRQLYFQ